MNAKRTNDKSDLPVSGIDSIETHRILAAARRARSEYVAELLVGSARTAKAWFAK